ncbi:MAG TPA: C-type lectin domain-containing protein [Polyangiaceae bacterium]|jgi:hypothetical protein
MRRETKATRSCLQVLLCLLAIVCLFGCSGAPEKTGTISNVLTFPVSITIATPNPVSPLNPVATGSNSLQLGAGAEIVTGVGVAMGSGLQTQPDALLNETWSRGTAVLNDRVKVRGTLHAKTHTSSSSATITTLDQAPAFDPPATLSWNVNYPTGPANDVTVNSGTSTSLAPGKYGTITINSQGVLTLKTGTYFLTAFSHQSAAVVKLDQADGPVIIYTTSSVTLRGSFTPLSGTVPDLLITQLGTTPVIVESLFNGALLAPATSITLRSLNSLIHTGFFYAKDMILDAHARVQYRRPLAVVGAANPPGATCLTLLAGQVPDKSINHYCKCQDHSDTDRDGVEDCADGCPADPHKTAPGLCNCGIPDTDSDGDHVPDCLDRCPADPNNTSSGQCGCSGLRPELPGLKPAGTKCTDTGCPQSNATCSANGVCGNRSACAPAPACTFVNHDRASYWVCPGPVTQSAAAQACRAKQMGLVRIDGFLEDQFVRSLVTAPVWIGANSITASGVWRWTTATSNNGDQFWQGAANGAQRNSLFSYWATGAPASQRCAVVEPGSGRWLDVDCSEALGYICEFDAPVVAPPPDSPPGRPQDPPADAPCISETAAGLTDSGTDLLNDLKAADAGVFQGAAANPPSANESCPADDPLTNGIGDVASGAGCSFTASDPNFQCFADADCNRFGANVVCRQIKDDPNCVPLDASAPLDGGGGSCIGHSRCGTLNCPSNQPTTPCDTIQVCNPNSEFDAGLDLGANLTPAPFDPGGMFDGGVAPDAGSAGVYSDPPTGTGKDHSWCKLGPQNPVPDATQSKKDTGGQSGSSSPISFAFQPDLTFDSSTNPLSLGETDLKVHAAAQLVTTATLNDFLGSHKNFTVPILKAVADIKAERCTLRDDDSKFEVFDIDFIEDSGVPIFNTSAADSEFHDATVACNNAVGEFITLANRAKKAFRDAQNLLKQYQALKSGNLGHFEDLCQQLIGSFGSDTDIPFFPGGLDCPANEPAEITINRFLDYYQAPGFGQITQLKQGVANLLATTKQLQQALSWSDQIPFADIGNEQSQTILSVPFAIGPIPMVFQIDAFYSYGVAGFFEVALKFPFDPLDTTVGERDEIAHVKAGVLPHAAAGLSAFVGAGGGLGGFSATLGIEGALTLGNVKAPIFAGAGVGAEILQDIRPIPTDLQPPIGVLTDQLGLSANIGIPRSFKFFVWYDYGAGLQISDVLKGEVNARLKIKFFFFSRTWKKRVIKFNGFSRSFDLLSGKLGTDPSVGMKTEAVDQPNGASTSTNTVEGTTNTGQDEAPTQLAALASLPVPDSQPANTPMPFNPTEVESVLYDQECCARVGQKCLGPSEAPSDDGRVPCCPGLTCGIDADQGTACRLLCKDQGAACTANSDCCPQDQFTVTCGPQNTCVKCGNSNLGVNGGAPCTQNSDCCNFDVPADHIECGPLHTCVQVIQ